MTTQQSVWFTPKTQEVRTCHGRTIRVAMYLACVYGFFRVGGCTIKSYHATPRLFLEEPPHLPIDAIYSRYPFITVAWDTIVLPVSILFIGFSPLCHSLTMPRFPDQLRQPPPHHHRRAGSKRSKAHGNSRGGRLYTLDPY